MASKAKAAGKATPAADTKQPDKAAAVAKVTDKAPTAGGGKKVEPVAAAASPKKAAEPAKKEADKPPPPPPAEAELPATPAPATPAAPPPQVDSADESDPYAVSSDEEEEGGRPPPQIDLGVDLSSIKSKWTKPAGDMKHKGRQKLTDIDPDKYSKFKSRFEPGADAGDDEDDAERSPRRAEFHDDVLTKRGAAKQRAQKAFMHMTNPNDESFVECEPAACAVCAQPVYKADRVRVDAIALWHRSCFKCAQCGKAMALTNYNLHGGSVLCKGHHKLATEPESMAGVEPATVPEEEHVAPADVSSSDEEEYALVSRPRRVNKNVVQSGLRTYDDLKQLPKLSNVKEAFAQSQGRAENGGAKLRDVDAGIESGAVKERMSRFLEGDAHGESESETDDERPADDNVVRSSRRRRKEKLHFDSTKGIKSKWETGAMNGEAAAGGGGGDERSRELEELKGTSVRDRFKERTGNADGQEQAAGDARQMVKIDAALSGEAMRKFKEGTAWQDGAKPDRTSKEDIHFAELGSFKERFEKGTAADDGQPAGDRASKVDVRCAELGNIKRAFEQGEFARGQEESSGGASGDESDVRRCAELGNIKQRFEQPHDEPAVKPRKQPVALVEDGEAAATAANLRAQFEASRAPAGGEVMDEARRKQLEEEFKRLKELKESSGGNGPESEEATSADWIAAEQARRDEEMDAIHPEHAAKMALKWEKMQAKEKKKAERAQAKRPLAMASKS